MVCRCRRAGFGAGVRRARAAAIRRMRDYRARFRASAPRRLRQRLAGGLLVQACPEPVEGGRGVCPSCMTKRMVTADVFGGVESGQRPGAGPVAANPDRRRDRSSLNRSSLNQSSLNQSSLNQSSLNQSSLKPDLAVAPRAAATSESESDLARARRSADDELANSCMAISTHRAH